ncbi:hypothetical protein [Massilia soli]|uniref:Uncharacterized protein n=1 Tax=Massilia soli TaxID=2792854 RepID=A0ABS7SUN5_9BURK|nr:hypothetical protein [Massilia soli]MBZ2209652.1 hypothetical protein [Massilia soli]
MQHTLVAVFDNSADARNAMDDLLASGFSRADVRLSNSDASTDANLASVSDSDGGDSFGDSIRNFFSDLFGSDSTARSSMYSDAVSRGNCVLTVTTQSEPEVERAADVVEAHGPIDIDEHHDMPMGGNSDMRSAAMARGAEQGVQQSSQYSMQSGSGTSTSGSAMSAQGTGSGGSRQFAEGDSQAFPVVRDELKTGNRDVQRGGMRIFSRAVDDPADRPATIAMHHTDVDLGNRSAMDNDDDYYRSHWNSNFAGTDKSYDDVAPAYEYGSTMRRSELYRGRPFEDVETDLRSDWNQRNPGSTWESIKAAVRHGWDRLTN